MFNIIGFKHLNCSEKSLDDRPVRAFCKISATPGKDIFVYRIFLVILMSGVLMLMMSMMAGMSLRMMLWSSLEVNMSSAEMGSIKLGVRVRLLRYAKPLAYSGFDRFSGLRDQDSSDCHALEILLRMFFGAAR